MRYVMLYLRLKLYKSTIVILADRISYKMINETKSSWYIIIFTTNRLKMA